jgi:ubiquitin C-terminal hydrolase
MRAHDAWAAGAVDDDTRMVDELARLFDEMKEHSMSPMRFAATFRRRMRGFLHAGEQMDMGEVLALLVDTIEGELKDVGRAPAALTDVSTQEAAFQAMVRQASAAWTASMAHCDPTLASVTTGLQVGQVVCATCNRVYHNFETFTFLPLEIKDDDNEPLHLSSCVEGYLAGERLNGGGTRDWKCDACGTYEPAEKLARFWRAPEMLVLVLKRFRSAPSGRCVKITTPVDIPSRMDFLPGTELSALGGGQPAYTLKSIGCHFGSLEHGHYTALCLGADGNWRHFDDLHVNTISADRVLKNNAHAYMLFYERVQSKSSAPV